MRKLALLVAVGGLTAVAPSASAGGVKRCSNVGGYYNVTVRNMTCQRAAHILWRARQTGSTHIEGYSCQITGHGPGGGFPAEAVCKKGSAHARGWVIDGPA